jgi:hypothetical protein
MINICEMSQIELRNYLKNATEAEKAELLAAEKEATRYLHYMTMTSLCYTSTAMLHIIMAQIEDELERRECVAGFPARTARPQKKGVR